MLLRFDKVVRVAAPGLHRAYSLVLTDEGLYLIRTGSARALKHYRREVNDAVTPARPPDAAMRDLQAQEDRIAITPLGDLAREKDNYLVRLEAVDDLEVRSSKREPELWIGVTGSEHHLIFPFATLEEVRTLERALGKWLKAS